jgi:hypothetical protein
MRSFFDPISANDGLRDEEGLGTMTRRGDEEEADRTASIESITRPLGTASGRNVLRFEQDTHDVSHKTGPQGLIEEFQ